MSVRYLHIEHFRGIKTLDWTLGDELVCLIGPGDSGKTTILDAIEWALWPRRNLHVTDADFYGLDTSQPIAIEVTLIPVPEELATDGVFGQHLRGWRDGKLLEEPEDGAETAMTIRLEVGEELEPEWTVVVDRETIEPVSIGAKRRAMFGVVRLRGWHVRDLTWARGSAFSRAIDAEGSGGVLTKAHREARDLVKIELDDLAESLQAIGEAAAEFGAGTSAIEELGVVLDPAITGLGEGALVLAGSEIPLARAGLGTSRLVALAVQALAAGEAGILLIDEVEHGLEPHRVIGLINEMRRRLGGVDAEMPGGGRVFLTTHSPVAVSEIGPNGVHTVRSEGGVVTVKAAGDDLAGLVRGFPSALLARRVLVCEGRTEMGICRSLERKLWIEEEDRHTFAHIGVETVDGRGSDNAPKTALRLAELGYEVLLFADSDVPLGVGIEELDQAGVEVVQWGEDLATEERAATDLPIEGLVEMVQHVIDNVGSDSVRDSLNSRLEGGPRLEGDDPGEWIDQIGEDEFRHVFGRAAKKNKTTEEGPKPKGWFKTIDGGQVLGELVARYWAALDGTDLKATLIRLRQWVYQDGS